MDSVLALIETRNGVVQPISFEILGAARQFAHETGAKVEALLLGADLAKLAPTLGVADAIVSVSHPNLEHYIPEAALAVLVDVVAQRKPTAVFFAYDSVGLDLAPGLALLTNRSLVGYVTNFSAPTGFIEAESQAHGGKVRIASRAPLPAIVTIMPGAFLEAASVGTPEVVEFPPPPQLETLRTQFLSESEPDLAGFNLTAADKIVCVGRGVKDKDAVEGARKLAAALGAEIAGSRPIIDNGWLPKERQVGKSGRKVKPKLYLALGVSGAPEHLEGMSGAELIVAVNTDKKAPIFGVAHYGATCDLLEFVPALGERLRD